MNTDFNNKIIFITGASSGIGRACARLFASLGAKLILCARRLEKLQALANELVTSNIHLIKLDVRSRHEVEKAIASLPSDWKKIDVLINNAGLAAGFDKFQEGNIDDWESMIDTNIKGLLYVSRAIIPLMQQQNTGHIVNIGSTAGHQVYPNGNVYCATKYAVKALSRSLKIDLIGTPLRVTSIDPGMVETEFSEVRFKGDKQRAETVYKGMTPLSPDDIADAIHYAVSRPSHVNISEILLMPTDQATATIVARKEEGK